MSDVLKTIKDYWDRHAQRDPLWAVLSDTAKREGKWDVARFFQTGKTEIESLLYELDAQQFTLRPGSAMDFGCGVGRLTQALAPHFDRVVGVDVSPNMLDLAARLNQYADAVSYICNQATDLRIFDERSFDFIVSNIVLQHLPPEISCSYLHEFFRVLAPAGIVVFQLPSHRKRLQNRPLESNTNPMPDLAYSASIAVTGMPRGIEPLGQVTLQVKVTNISSFDWYQREYGVMSVGDHWLDAAGLRMLARDDGRTRLPETLRAGESSSVALTIRAPSNPGEYQLEVDVAHEGVLWFQDRGSEVVRLAVCVAPNEIDTALASSIPSSVDARTHSAEALNGGSFQALASPGAKLDVDDPGEFPMHGVPLHAVAGLIAEHGATLLHVENDRSCGEEWVSYRYFARAAGSAAC
ncbi:MAG TPA: class I SAM-dependent methyltransferase [Vicinamibacterales bacterium]|jgi:SAM-dependent methyltransferase|nr:class I SAM-dependent methyltransferase [Vicinamibacterales bacterium]